MILFQASTWFTELVSAKKYPEYKEYQRRVGKFIPTLTTDLPGDFSDQKSAPKTEEVATSPKDVKIKNESKTQKASKTSRGKASKK